MDELDRHAQQVGGHRPQRLEEQFLPGLVPVTDDDGCASRSWRILPHVISSQRRVVGHSLRRQRPRGSLTRQLGAVLFVVKVPVSGLEQFARRAHADLGHGDLARTRDSLLEVLTHGVEHLGLAGASHP